MKELDLALAILNDDLDDNTPFQEALRKIFAANADLREYRSGAAGMVGCALRHHLLFNFLTSSYSDFTVEEKRLVHLAYANIYFTHRFSKEEMAEALKEKLPEEKFAKVSEFIESNPDATTLIPERIAKPSNQFLSLRYNFPEWTLKIFQKEGYGAAYHTIRALSKPYFPTVRVTNRLSEEKKAELTLEPTSVEGIYTYKGKEALRKHESIRRLQAFEERPYVKMVYDLLKVNTASNILLYSGQEDEEWDMEMLESMSFHSNVNIAVPDMNKRVHFSRYLKTLGFRNVNLFEAPNPDEMLAAISHSCEVVFAVPNSSLFDRIPTTPDFLIHYNREAMEEVYKKQSLVLGGCAKHVAEGGSLVYCVPTISRREGHGVVNAFLQAHPEFSLDKEEQLLPYKDPNVAFYYAILYKGEKAKITDVPPISSEFFAKAETVVNSAKTE